jgi:hypothetical protein
MMFPSFKMFTVDPYLCEQKQETFLSAEDLNSYYSEYVETQRGNATFELTFKFPNFQKMLKSFVSITSFEKDGDWIRLTKPVLPDFLQAPDDWKKIYSKDTEKKKDSHYLYPYFSRFQLKKVSDDETHYSVIYSIFFILKNFKLVHLLSLQQMVISERRNQKNSEISFLKRFKDLIQKRWGRCGLMISIQD